MKSARTRSYSGPYFLAFGLNADQNNSEYGHLLRSATGVENLDNSFSLFMACKEIQN